MTALSRTIVGAKEKKRKKIRTGKKRKYSGHAFLSLYSSTAISSTASNSFVRSTNKKNNKMMAKVKELQQYIAQCIAECFGTFMLILIGEASIAQYKLSRQGNHSIIPINLSFGIGVYTGIDFLSIYISVVNNG